MNGLRLAEDFQSRFPTSYQNTDPFNCHGRILRCRLLRLYARYTYTWVCLLGKPEPVCLVNFTCPINIFFRTGDMS